MYFYSFQKHFKNASPSSKLLNTNPLENQSALVYNKKFLMHRNRFSSKSWCFRVHVTLILVVLLNVKEESWHITVFLALCSWSLSLPLQDQRTVHVNAMQGLPVRSFRLPQKWHITVAAVSKQESNFMQSIIFSIPLPLKGIYPSWNCPLKSHNLDFLFQQDRYKSLQPLHRLVAENFCFYEFWNISANSNDCHCLLATSNQQIPTATSCS